LATNPVFALDDAEKVASFEGWTIPDHAGLDAPGMLWGLAGGDLAAAVLLGADPVRDTVDGDLARRALEAAEFVVAIALFLTDSSSLADVVLPAEGFAEKEGTYTNLEGRVAKVNQVVAGPGQTQPDWSILEEIARRMGRSMGFESAGAIADEVAEVAPAYAGVTWRGVERTISLQGTDLNIGLLYVLAMSSIGVYAIVMAGWASGSKYPLLGGVRGTAQAISYEAAMGLALVPVVFYSGSLSLKAIVAAQAGSMADLFGWPILAVIPRWNIIPMFVSFAIFFIAGVAETNRAPFDLVEAEQEIVGGFHTEYSGLRFAMFFLAEYINMFNMAALVTTLFLGGWNGPQFAAYLPAWISQGVLPFAYFMVKTVVVLFVFMWIRATFPRLRYDQLMVLGWKRLIPAALAWLVLSAVVIGFRQFGAPWS
jgi:NADH:ubiquinone oxidoreductase subunit H